MGGPGCNSDGPTTKCGVLTGSSFTVNFAITALPTQGSYAGYDLEIAYPSAIVNYVAGSLVQTGAGTWPSCGIPVGDGPFLPGDAKTACTLGVSSPTSTYLGTLGHLDFACRGQFGSRTFGTATLTLVNGNGHADIINGAGTPVFEPANETITINCLGESPTPPPPTATATPTATPTPIPRVQKSPALQNVFLTRQGAKIPPATCEAGTNVATLKEGINIPISSLDPKGITGSQVLAAFQFDVRFDAKLACVSIAPGPAWVSASAICSTLLSNGLIHFGCVTAGKGHNLNATVPAQPLAIISVRPQPLLYSQLRPNQDNGIPVQIMNQGCQLSDEQGHPITIFSCESAGITFRYLEGDVDGPNCVVNVVDAQQIAFRWGASIGSLLYSPFFDLSPSGQIKGDGLTQSVAGTSLGSLLRLVDHRAAAHVPDDDLAFLGIPPATRSQRLASRRNTHGRDLPTLLRPRCPQTHRRRLPAHPRRQGQASQGSPHLRHDDRRPPRSYGPAAGLRASSRRRSLCCTMRPRNNDLSSPLRSSSAGTTFSI